MRPLVAEHTRRALDGAFWTAAAQALMVPTGLATVAYLTRALGLSAYGDYSVIITLIAWIQFCIAAIFGRAAVKFVSQPGDWRAVAASLLRASLVAGLAAMLVVCLAAEHIAQALGSSEMASCLRLAAIDLPLYAVSNAYLHVLIGLRNFRARALAGALRWVSRLVLIVVLVELGLSVEGAILGCIGASLVELLACHLYCRMSWLQRGNLPWGQLWSYFAPLCLATICLRVFDGLDLVALKMLGGTADEIGLYGAALNLTLLPGIIATAVGPILHSSLARLRSQGNDLAARQMAQQALRGLLLMLPIAGLIAGSATEIARLCFGPEYAGAGPLLSLLIFAGTARLMITICVAILIAVDRPNLTLYVTAPLVPLAVLGHVVLIPRLGGAGAACITVTCSGLIALACLLAIRRLWSISPPGDTSLRCLAIGVIAFAVSEICPVPPLWLPLKLAAIMVLAGVGLLLAGEFDRHERFVLRSLLRPLASIPEGPKS